MKVAVYGFKRGVLGVISHDLNHMAWSDPTNSSGRAQGSTSFLQRLSRQDKEAQPAREFQDGPGN